MPKAIWVLLGLAVSLPLHAQSDKVVRSLAANCAACHGTNGNSVGGSAVLAGMDKEDFINKMMAFKSGATKSSIMHRHAKGYTDEEIQQLAAFFAAQPRGK